MGATTSEGTGHGSAETPIRPLQQLTKVVSLDEQVAFDVDGQTHRTRKVQELTQEEQDTGKKFYDGRTIYQKMLVADSFTVASSYGRLPHDISSSFDLVSAMGYVSGTYATYANYKDGTNFYFFWSGSGAFPVHVLIEYVYN